MAATNALELGIDIGSLDAAVLAGYPGTRASMWQQAGRAGRRSGSSLAVLVAQDDPLDQYLMQHPEDLFEKPPEAAVVDPTNPYVIGPHIACAAREQPLAEAELGVFGDAAAGAVEDRVEAGELFWRRGLLYHRGRESPHRKIDIRSASGELFAIVDGETGALLGTVDESRAFHHVHPGRDLPPSGRAVRGVGAGPGEAGGRGREERRRLLHAAPAHHGSRSPRRRGGRRHRAGAGALR